MANTSYMKDYYIRNKKKLNEASALWRKNNPQKVKELKKKWRECHKKQCKDCLKEWRHKNIEHSREYHRNYGKKNRESANLSHTKWKKKNKYKVASLNRKSYLKKTYSLTLEQYDKMFEIQGGVCAICNQPETWRRLSVDHNHQTGKVRGLLCSKCNTDLGIFEKKLDSFLSYFKKYEGIKLWQMNRLYVINQRWKQATQDTIR